MSPTARVPRKLELVIGNKNYSSWSMRAWMLLRFAELPFVEINIDLYSPGSRAEVRALGGETGLVPVLIADGQAIWETAAITEYAYELCPAVWPKERYDRARARAYAAEVHSGLNAVRAAMPCNARARHRVAERSAAVETEIGRVAEIWSRAGDGWLFDDFCAADIMFAPVAARFQTYDVDLDAAAKPYWQRLLSHPLAVEWFRLGEAESMVIDQFELPKRKAVH